MSVVMAVSLIMAGIFTRTEQRLMEYYIVGTVLFTLSISVLLCIVALNDDS